MCGITGIFDLRDQRTIDTALLQRMNDRMLHRGPDESGIFSLPGVGLAHRRLSIIDLSSGQQPLSNQAKSVTVTYNGEIYNYRELRKELVEMGYAFQTHSDTEVLVHAWSAWGESCVSRFRGMFAFALWDQREKVLFVARDRLGIKPLFYAVSQDGFLLLASELKALTLYPGLEKKIQNESIEDYFALGYVPEPKTIYADIKKLPAGHTMTVSLGRSDLRLNQYWDVPFKRQTVIDPKDLQVELVERLKEAVSVRMVADVPLGAFLSGGVDSSAVVALMASLQDEPVNTCSIGFNEAKYNESDYAQRVADRYKTNHTLEIVGEENIRLVDELARLYDEPYADSSAIPTYQVCQLARKKVTVALSGDGADELMSGYRRHVFHMKEEAVRARLPLALRRRVFGLLGYLYPKADWAPQWVRAKSTFQALARDSVSAYFHTVSQVSDNIRQNLFSPAFKKALGGYNAVEVFHAHAKNAPDDHPLSLIQYLDLKTYLVDDILTKVDRASMAHSLEVRVPILDHLFVEWVTGIPAEVKLHRGVGKAIMKQSMEPYLPHDILYRQKMGFSLPLSQWFRGPLQGQVKDALLSERLQDSGYFNMRFLTQVINEHQRGIRDHGVLIWSLFMFDAFLKQ